MRQGFLTSTYGTRDERVRLSGTPHRSPTGVWRPSWASGGEAWGLITAYNPLAQHQPPGENDAADHALREHLSRQGIPAERALNGEGEWTEPAWLVRDVGVRTLAELGVAYGQVAVVWGAGARAALVWTGVCPPDAEGPRAGSVRFERRWVVPL